MGLVCKPPARGMLVWDWELVAVLGTPGLSPLLPAPPPLAAAQRCPRARRLILPRGFAALSLPDVSSLDTVLELPKDTFNCISRCRPGALYSQLCQLLALATGNQDPLLTAYLLSESVSVVTHHQLLSIAHRKIRRKKSAGDVAEQLRGLSLQEGSAAQHSRPLAELQSLFMFSSTGLGSEERDSFWTQLQQMPSDATSLSFELPCSAHRHGIIRARSGAPSGPPSPACR
ncbi:separin-like [Harpia harpyja]|uniref:separin-like n=1 Tax=Harpia harpyja TaxID=202280 RepID=UPI0022B2112E|nr:separin-like [Harpia harpyja]